MTCIFSSAKKQFSQLLLEAIPATLHHAGVITKEANEYGLRSHFIHTKSQKDWFRHSNVYSRDINRGTGNTVIS
jgi:hypothetical protein